MRGFLTLRKCGFSFIYEKKNLIIILLAVLTALLSIILSLSMGNINIPFIDVIKTLFSSGEGGNSLIINTLRLPRTLVAFFVGASLGLSGSILQGVVKNPLADPGVMGIVDSGSAGALVFLTLFTDSKNNSLTTSIFYMPVFAFAGAFLAILMVYLLAFKRGVTPYRLILIGIAVSGAAKALNSILIINGPVVFIKEAQLWITGTVYGTNWIHFKLLSSWFVVLFLISIFLVREVNLQSLEDNVSLGLGTKLERNRFLLMLLSAALASGGVAVGGGIGFVGLIAPHISRRLTSSSFGNLLFLSPLTGGTIVVIADIAARKLFFPLDLPVGVFTAGIGAPFFIYLLIKNQRQPGRGI